MVAWDLRLGQDSSLTWHGSVSLLDTARHPRFASRFIADGSGAITVNPFPLHQSKLENNVLRSIYLSQQSDVFLHIKKGGLSSPQASL